MADKSTEQDVEKEEHVPLLQQPQVARYRSEASGRDYIVPPQLEPQRRYIDGSRWRQSKK